MELENIDQYRIYSGSGRSLQMAGLAEQRYQALTMYAKGLACDCDEPNLVAYSALAHGRNAREVLAPLGAFCLSCLKPTKYTLVHAIVECEGCELPYVPVPARESYPLPRVKLCPDCDAKVPTRRRVVKRPT